MYDMETRNDRPTLGILLEELLHLAEASAEKVASTGQALGAFLHVEQINAEKEEMTRQEQDELLELHSQDGSGNIPSFTRVAACRCSRKDARGIVCSKEDGHFCCDKCFSELVYEHLGAPEIVCREANCKAVYITKQIYDHVEEKLFYNHISEAERSTFLQDLWGRGATRVMHVGQNEALNALNAMASRDPGHPEFPPLCVLCLVTSRRAEAKFRTHCPRSDDFFSTLFAPFPKSQSRRPLKSRERESGYERQLRH
jgi:hypothetical protein